MLKVYNSVESAMAYLNSRSEIERIFCIGGGSLYRECIPFCSKIYLTRINKIFEGCDAFFSIPDGEFQLESNKEMDDMFEEFRKEKSISGGRLRKQENTGIEYEFLIYSRTF